MTLSKEEYREKFINKITENIQLLETDDLHFLVGFIKKLMDESKEDGK
jgi:hypothetical protein